MRINKKRQPANKQSKARNKYKRKKEYSQMMIIAEYQSRDSLIKKREQTP